MTCVHKANIMKLGDGLFPNTFRKVAEEYKSSGIEFNTNDMIVDKTCALSSRLLMKLISIMIVALCSLLHDLVNSTS